MTPKQNTPVIDTQRIQRKTSRHIITRNHPITKGDSKKRETKQLQNKQKTTIQQ